MAKITSKDLELAITESQLEKLYETACERCSHACFCNEDKCPIAQAYFKRKIYFGRKQ